MIEVCSDHFGMGMQPVQVINQLIENLENGNTSSRALVEECLARIDDPAGEGKRVFVHVDRENALAQADAIDKLRQNGAALSKLAGIPMSIKDLFDIQGQTSAAGSKVLKGNQVAEADCPAVARLRSAGLVLIGRTNMTEFAYPGLGLNPHYDTPRNPYDRDVGRAPGGSSSGAAVSVTDGMAAAGLGTDTGGSCRIPAAMCGITGYKPTQARVPLDGVVPLSSSLDSIGPLAQTVDCCAAIDEVLAAKAHNPVARPLSGLRLGVIRDYVLEDMDDHVAGDFDRACQALSAAGVSVVDVGLPVLLELNTVNAKGGFAGAESYAWHRPYIETRGDEYDPRVSVRIMTGKDVTAAEYLDVMAARTRIIETVNAASLGVDALICPTIPIIAPTLAELADDAAYGHRNMLVLRNPAVTNFLDRCAIALPMHRPGDAPTSLMLVGEHMGDSALFDVARSVETVLQT
jgi:aspartyl-tRNA(Asn)/glutamyl-tRNA(Gln) amidotransferase subunit A